MTAKTIHEKILLILQSLNLKAKRILDIGCGNGEFTIRLAQAVHAEEVYGVDIDEKALEQAGKIGIKVTRVDVYRDRLPFPDEFFDLCCAIEVIEHLPFSDNMMLEVNRVTRDGGYLIISTPNLASIVNRILLLLGYQPTICIAPSLLWHVGLPGGPKKRKVSLPDSMPEPYTTHLNAYTLKALRDLLNVYGFKVLKIEGATIPTPNKIRTFIAKLFERFPSLADDIIVLAQKTKHCNILRY